MVFIDIVRIDSVVVYFVGDFDVVDYDFFDCWVVDVELFFVWLFV